MDLNVSKNTSIKGGMSASGEQVDGQSKLKITDENTLTEILDLLIDECEFVVEEQVFSFFYQAYFLERRRTPEGLGQPARVYENSGKVEDHKEGLQN